ncbi:aldo/keto reductase [Komagataeibacter nataicola]|uniref:Aldo/keto reductase n=1 Tax=Komagataeibacter nataicola TaxID=265960 RepID=A0A9N7CEF8_9PROT|nr:aldo/keto reductase [Komagataeibacter nataicola]AQU87939.1 aldo/keto reductase [Komagataeibacter nataicola]PYD66469.1 aldo/keto reductase [Komagataeibacter nataicola]WEQ55658.1 aldo/keto reductase [Komagataeibacter nataicola]WNM09474.1 aldo/keto reductase [Komagataeibacter nataicola]GBR26607.1 2,5-diketo-D-gluconate reductase [Komagataeibacter nataicola NRIC 0616]
MTTIPLLTLNDGRKIPAIGFGTYPLDNPQAEAAVREALAAGYRLFDTAARYGNESGVGTGLLSFDVGREDIFVTTKLRGAEQGFDSTLRAFEASLERLKMSYIDMYLIHWPLPGKDLYVESWKAMIRLQKEGRVRSIGVSNFLPEHLQRLIDETGVTPAVNQIEMHVDFAQAAQREVDSKLGILTQAWSPLGRGDILKDPTLGRVAERHGRTPAQVMLRWVVQTGSVPIPKSAHPERMRANLRVFDFQLTDEDMRDLATLDAPSHRTGGDPATYIEE